MSDEELLADLTAFGVTEGLIPCPEGAAGLTARHRRDAGWLGAAD